MAEGGDIDVVASGHIQDGFAGFECEFVAVHHQKVLVSHGVYTLL
jgi:hypothetical protein